MSRQTDSILSALKDNGVDFVVTVPDKFIDDLIQAVDNDAEIFHSYVTREEEGLGILAGAHLAGRKTAMILQNSGLGNSLNAIQSLINYYRIPVVFLVSYRGTEAEKIDAQKPMGVISKGLLKLSDIETHEITKGDDFSGIADMIKTSLGKGKSVAFLFHPHVWKESP